MRLSMQRKEELQIFLNKHHENIITESKKIYSSISDKCRRTYDEEDIYQEICLLLIETDLQLDEELILVMSLKAKEKINSR